METDHDNDSTPYLVSRFYRPPEVILGPSVTLAEPLTGSLFSPDESKNAMQVCVLRRNALSSRLLFALPAVYRQLTRMGPLSHRMAKRHALSYERTGLQPHFEVGQSGGPSSSEGRTSTTSRASRSSASRTSCRPSRTGELRRSCSSRRRGRRR